MMNNTKIGGRISEIDIIRFVMEKLNNNVYDVKFKMGLNDNIQWYRPYSKATNFINQEYVYDEETYQSNVLTFIPTMVDLVDIGLSSNLDMVIGSASVALKFMVIVDDPTSEIYRLVIEEMRDTFRQGFYVYDVPQRPYANPNGNVTFKQFKFWTNSGTIIASDSQDTINGKKFVEFEFSLDINFSDMARFGNEYLIEMAIKQEDGSYSAWERMYPLNTNLAIANSTQDKQELYQYAEKSYIGSNESEFNTSIFRYTAPNDIPVEDVNLNWLPIGTIIKTTVSSVVSYYKVVGDITPEEEQKAWETHSVWQGKGFSIVLDFIYRKPYSNETVGILTHLFNEIVKRKFGTNIYKLRISHYNLEENGSWTLDEVLFERPLIITHTETIIALGELQPMTVPFAVSDIE